MSKHSHPPILLYTMGHCPYCAQAKALLREKGIHDWEEHDLEIMPEKRIEMIAMSGGRRTVPQIFIGTAHIGGSDDLYSLDAKGALDPLLKVAIPA